MMKENPKPEAIYSLGAGAFRMIYSESEQAQIAEMFGSPPPLVLPQEIGATSHDLSGVRFLFSGWGSPPADDKLFAALPSLELILYGAGATDHLTTDRLKNSRVRLTSAIAINAIPVAEFTFACIIFGLKNVVHLAARRYGRRTYDSSGLPPFRGAYRTRVGLVSLGYIGRLVAEKLRSVDVELVAYDPFVSPDAAARSGAKLVGLDELFASCDVVSLHTPLNEKTKGMFTRGLFDRMKEGATLINTARARLIRAGDLEAFLTARPDVQAFIDVTYPEPLPEDSPLWDLPNTFLTPHIAGSFGNECYRMGRAMIGECKRYLAREPLEYEVPLR
ncbi:MAG: hydroxyacid dehydrogenase [Opitutales bacterium]|nr:hydroxyacid dehydrogenase [Opitutales bacterium]